MLGLRPSFVLRAGWLCQLGTYMFLHGRNFSTCCSTCWRLDVRAQLEQKWGTRYFLSLLVTGIGAVC